MKLLLHNKYLNATNSILMLRSLRTGINIQILYMLIVLSTLVVALSLPLSVFAAPAPNDTPTYLRTLGGAQAPQAVTTDSANNVYITDTINNRVQKFDSTGTLVLQWGTSGTGNGQFIMPLGIIVDSLGNVYVSDTFNHRVQKFDSTGAYVSQWGTSGTGNGQFDVPSDIAIDDTGNIYISDTFNDRIQTFDSTGAYVSQWGTSGAGNGEFNEPVGIDFDSIGNIYVVDRYNNRVQKFNSTGAYLAQWATLGNSNMQLNTPTDIAIDSNDIVYVTDKHNDRIQLYSYPTEEAPEENGNDNKSPGTQSTTNTQNQGDNSILANTGNGSLRTIVPAVLVIFGALFVAYGGRKIHYKINQLN